MQYLIFSFTQRLKQLFDVFFQCQVEGIVSRVYRCPVFNEGNEGRILFTAHESLQTYRFLAIHQDLIHLFSTHSHLLTQLFELWLTTQILLNAASETQKLVH